MRKYFLSAAILFLAIQSNAQDTTTRMITRTHRTITTTHTRTHNYYYYPDQNVYYDAKSGDYYYYDEPATQWTTVRVLPATIAVDDKNRYKVNYNSNDVYRENAKHQNKYKIKKNGEAKVKD